VETFAFVLRELTVQAGEADCRDGAAFALFYSFQAHFQLFDKTVAARWSLGAGGNHLLQQGWVQIFRHAGGVTVTPVALQGEEMLFSAFQEAGFIKPRRCLHGDRLGDRLRGSGSWWRPALRTLWVFDRAASGVWLALHRARIAPGKQ